MIEMREGVAKELAPSIESVVASHQTLEDVVRWGLSQRPPRLVERVVVQDEYTHDVVIAYADDVYLVYDTT
jgi:hypothetical protein